MRLAALLALLVALPVLAADKAPAATGKTIEIKVTDKGFEPKEVKVKKGFMRLVDSVTITPR